MRRRASTLRSRLVAVPPVRRNLSVAVSQASFERTGIDTLHRLDGAPARQLGAPFARRPDRQLRSQAAGVPATTNPGLRSAPAPGRDLSTRSPHAGRENRWRSVERPAARPTKSVQSTEEWVPAVPALVPTPLVLFQADPRWASFPTPQTSTPFPSTTHRWTSSPLLTAVRPLLRTLAASQYSSARLDRRRRP